MVKIPGNVPNPRHVMHDVGFTGGDHLVRDLDEERGHSLRGIIVLRDAVDHTDGIHQTRDVLNHRSLSPRKQRQC